MPETRETMPGTKSRAPDRLDLFDEVRTNRLHDAICAGLLGKRVKMYPNSYFKNRAVYEFSMRDRFPDVEWVEMA